MAAAVLVLLTSLATGTAGGGHRLATGQPAAASRCPTAGGRVIADTSEVLVTAFSSTKYPEVERKAKFFACLKKTGVRRRLDRVMKTQFRVFPPKGRFVVATAYDSIEGYVAADLVDVASGVRYKLLRYPWEPGNGDIRILLLKTNGSAAFLTVTEPDILYRCEMSSCYTQRRRARLTKLDEGRIPPASVRLRGGTTIVWRDATGKRSSPLR